MSDKANKEKTDKSKSSSGSITEPSKSEPSEGKDGKSSGAAGPSAKSADASKPGAVTTPAGSTSGSDLEKSKSTSILEEGSKSEKSGDDSKGGERSKKERPRKPLPEVYQMKVFGGPPSPSPSPPPYYSPSPSPSPAPPAQDQPTVHPDCSQKDCKNHIHNPLGEKEGSRVYAKPDLSLIGKDGDPMLDLPAQDGPNPPAGPEGGGGGGADATPQAQHKPAE